MSMTETFLSKTNCGISLDSVKASDMYLKN